jgi:hypothetical protein
MFIYFVDYVLLVNMYMILIYACFFKPCHCIGFSVYRHAVAF